MYNSCYYQRSSTGIQKRKNMTSNDDEVGTKGCQQQNRSSIPNIERTRQNKTSQDITVARVAFISIVLMGKQFKKTSQTDWQGLKSEGLSQYHRLTAYPCISKIQEGIVSTSQCIQLVSISVEHLHAHTDTHQTHITYLNNFVTQRLQVLPSGE